MSREANDPQAHDLLIANLLDGKLTPAQEAELLAALRADEALAREVAALYVDGKVIESHLRGMPEQEFIDQVVSASEYAESREPFIEKVCGPAEQKPRRRGRYGSSSFLRRKEAGTGAWLKWTLLAATVLMAMGIGLLLSRQRSRPDRSQVRVVSTEGKSSAPEAQKPKATAPAVASSVAREQSPASPPVAIAHVQQEKAGRSLPSSPTPLLPRPPSRGQGDIATSRTPAPKPPAGVSETRPEEDIQETIRPIARVAAIEGMVMYARGADGRWLRATEGIRLLAGDRIDTRTGMTRLDLGDDAALFVNRGTVLRVLTALTAAGEGTAVELARGEVYVVDSGQRVHLVTREGLISPVGTRFDVKRTPSATIVAVERGMVIVRRRKAGKKLPLQGEDNSRVTTRLDVRRFSWVGKALRINSGFRVHVPTGAPVRVSKTTGTPGLWRGPLLRASVRRIVTQGLVAYWNFDEGFGRKTNDASGRGHQGTIENAAWLRGPWGVCLRFDSSGTVRFRGLDNEAFPRTGSLSFWLNADLPFQKVSPLFDDYDPRRNHVFVRTDPIRGPRMLQVTYQRKGHDFVFTNLIDLGRAGWHHLVLIWDTERDRGRVYLDGRSIYSAAITDAGWVPSGQRVRLGGGYRGLLDEVQLYARILSAEEIRGLHGWGALHRPPHAP